MYAEVYILCQQREGMAEIVHILIYHQMAAPEEGREKKTCTKTQGVWVKTDREHLESLLSKKDHTSSPFQKSSTN